jgi:SOS response regulatory protein OraA/RecX
MESLKKKGLINDLRYCRDWIEYRLHEKPRSLSFIKKELEEKGIDSRVMEESFGRFLPGVDDIDIAEGILRKKGSGLGEDVSDREKASLYRALLNRGFEPDLAEEALERFLNRDIS